MNGEEFAEELYREHLYFVYEDKCRELEKELDKFRPFKSAYEMKKEIKRLNNIINELEKYINEEYIYDELGMKIFDASKLQDKLQELKGEDKK